MDHQAGGGGSWFSLILIVALLAAGYYVYDTYGLSGHVAPPVLLRLNPMRTP
jgi:hypothetical protein